MVAARIATRSQLTTSWRSGRDPFATSAASWMEEADGRAVDTPAARSITTVLSAGGDSGARPSHRCRRSRSGSRGRSRHGAPRPNPKIVFALLISAGLLGDQRVLLAAVVGALGGQQASSHSCACFRWA
ncbi:unnamed protein product [Ectocarpus sp. CCAP 1310/34]|nr:unnamed protein product [Ectocarpus sp. CCAP 1310/34]